MGCPLAPPGARVLLYVQWLAWCQPFLFLELPMRIAVSMAFTLPITPDRVPGVVCRSAAGSEDLAG